MVGLSKAERRTLEIVATIRDDTSKILATMQKGVKRYGDNVQKQGERMRKTWTAVKASIAGVVAVLGVRQLARGFQSVIDSLDNIGKQARRLGLTVETLHGLRHAAELSGVAAEALDRGLKNLEVRTAQAVNGQQEMVRAFERLGVQFEGVNGQARRQDELLEDIAEAYVNATDKAQATEAIMRIIGEESGPQMLTMLEGGAKGLRDMAAEARRLNPVTEEQTKRAEKFNDAMARLRATLNRVVEAIVIDLAGDAVGALDDFGAWVRENGPAIVDTFRSIAKAVGLTVKAVVSIPANIEKIALELTRRDLLKQINAAEDRIRSLRDRLASGDSSTPRLDTQRLDRQLAKVVELRRLYSQAVAEIAGLAKQQSGDAAPAGESGGGAGRNRGQFPLPFQGDTQAARNFFTGLREGLKQFTDALGDAHEQGRRFALSAQDTFARGLGQAIADTARDVRNLADVWKRAGRQIVDTITDIIAQMIALRLVTAIGSIFSASATGTVGAGLAGSGAGAGATGGAGGSFGAGVIRGIGSGLGGGPSVQGGGGGRTYIDNRVINVNMGGGGDGNGDPGGGNFVERIKAAVLLALSSDPHFRSQMGGA